MKFLLDVCVSSRSLQSFLEGRAHDVLSVYSLDPKATDERILEVAFREDRVIVTEDNDFGELVFVRHLQHGPIVRVVDLSVDEQVKATAELLDQHTDVLHGPVLVTISRGRIRIRRV